MAKANQKAKVRIPMDMLNKIIKSLFYKI